MWQKEFGVFEKLVRDGNKKKKHKETITLMKERKTKAHCELMTDRIEEANHRWFWNSSWMMIIHNAIMKK